MDIIIYSEIFIDEKLDIQELILKCNKYDKNRIYKCINCDIISQKILYVIKNKYNIYIPYCTNKCIINKVNVVTYYIENLLLNTI